MMKPSSREGAQTKAPDMAAIDEVIVASTGYSVVDAPSRFRPEFIHELSTIK
jgi:hypothetical protein